MHKVNRKEVNCIVELNEKEWFALIAGLIVGRHKKQNRNKVDNAVTVNKKPIKLSKYATIGITAGTKYCDNKTYSLVRIPIMCTGVNIGVAAFVAKITWDSYAIYDSVDYGDFGTNIVIDESNVASRTLIVRGQNTSNMPQEDFVLFYLNLIVADVPTNVNKIYINCIKTTGTSMDDCSLLTIKDGGLFYITPIEANQGYIYFDIEDKPKDPPPTFEQPGPSNFPIGGNESTDGLIPPYGGVSTGEYSLTGYLGGAGGVGAYIVITIIQDGVVIGTDRQYVNIGNFKIDGKINLKTPNPGYGDITVKIEVETDEEDDTPYYLLIPAGGFNIFFKTEVNKEDNTFPKEPINVIYLDKVKINDLHDIEIYSNEAIDLDDVMEKINIVDTYETDTIKVNILEQQHLDEIGIIDLFDIDIESSPAPSDIDSIDTVSINDIDDITLISVTLYDKDTIEEIGLSDVCEIDMISTIITEENHLDSMSINDIYNIDFE